MLFKILVVDDEEAFCLSLSRILEHEGYACCTASNALTVEAVVQREHPDLIVMDVRMPGRDGLQVLARLRQGHRRLPILMVSGYATTEQVVQAMKIGAANFYTKPLNMPALLEEIRGFAEQAHRSGPPPDPQAARFLTRDPETLKMLELVKKVARTEVPVIITGESGTGKELIAHAIHHGSARAQGPLVKLNCAAIPESLMESELFGHEKGAYTGAVATRLGKFEEAQHGSIFLDEIGEMSLNTQAKLLRVLQERQVERLGSNQVRTLDVRFIAATNRSFEELIRDGRFRMDLFYRLSVVKLEIPPLRQRRTDIALLSEHLLQAFAAQYGKTIRGFAPEVHKIFQAHAWPGNVRELRNCIERAVIFAEGDTVQADSMPLHYSEVCRESVRDYHALLDQINREKILDALDQAGGNKTTAASLLNITRRTLYNKLKGLGITR
jgi:DNA-binding NtrC family response regulator